MPNVGRRPARITARIALAVLSLWLADCNRTAAQDAFRPARFEAGGEITWLASDNLGSQSATLTRNSSTDSTRFTLFDTEARLAAGVGVRATFAYRLTRWLTAEAAGQFRRSDVAISIREDAEGAADRAFAGEELDQYFLEGNALIRLPIGRSPRVWPFALAGAGYRRDVHQNRAAIDSGAVVHAGGGVKWVIRTRRRGWIKGFGARGDGRVTRRSGGFHLDRATSATPSASGGVFFVF